MSKLFLHGFMHTLQLAPHILILAALGLLLGQQGIRHFRAALPALVLSVASGLTLSRYYSPAWDMNLILPLLAACTGLLVILKLSLPPWVSLTLALLIGLLIGVGSNPFMLPGFSSLKVFTILAGVATSASLLVLCVSVSGFYINRLWQGIGLRVMGSWVTASALLVIALSFVSGK
jgi:urease accessory protein